MEDTAPDFPEDYIEALTLHMAIVEAKKVYDGEHVDIAYIFGLNEIESREE